MKKAGDLLTQAREAKGLTQEALGKQVKLSERQIVRYEKGNFPKFKTDKIKDIDKILGTNLSDIIYDKNVDLPVQTVSDAGSLMLRNQIEQLALLRVILPLLCEVLSPLSKEKKLPTELLKTYERMVKAEMEEVKKGLQL